MNAVMGLCAKGMELEGVGQPEEAFKLFKSAWDQSIDDFERCIAAHYVARHQNSPSDSLQWNQEALDCAMRVEDDRVLEFFASLYLNLGKAKEETGNKEGAKQLYESAAGKLNDVPEGPYKDIIRDGIDRGLKRVK